MGSSRISSSGLVDQRHRDGQPAPEAARERGHRHVGVGAQLEEVDQRLDPPAELAAPRAGGSARRCAGCRRARATRSGRSPGASRRAACAPRAAARVTSSPNTRSSTRASGRADAVDHAQGRGLARAVGAEQPEADARGTSRSSFSTAARAPKRLVTPRSETTLFGVVGSVVEHGAEGRRGAAGTPGQGRARSVIPCPPAAPGASSAACRTFPPAPATKAGALSRNDDALGRALARWVAFSLRHGRSVALLMLILSVLAACTPPARSAST